MYSGDRQRRWVESIAGGASEASDRQDHWFKDAAMSAGAWKLTNVLAAIYYTQSEKYAMSDILAVQRLTGMARVGAL